MSNNFARLLASCKCALYSPDGTQVLLADYGSHGYGLPGGHIDEGEEPDQAMHRELEEELGLKGLDITHADFWMHANGRLILGYVGRLDPATELTPQLSEMVGGYWASIADIESGAVVVASYKDFIVNHRLR